MYARLKNANPKFIKFYKMNSIFVMVLLLSLLNVFSCDKCSTELDVDYRGIPYSIDLAYESRNTFQDCCAFCDQVSQCMAWTFIYETQVCILKKGLGYRLPTKGSKINLHRKSRVIKYYPVIFIFIYERNLWHKISRRSV